MAPFSRNRAHSQTHRQIHYFIIGIDCMNNVIFLYFNAKIKEFFKNRYPFKQIRVALNMRTEFANLRPP